MRITHLSLWPNRFIKIGFFLLFALVPFLLTPVNYELFEYNKMIGVYALTIIIATSWLTRALMSREFRIQKTPLDIPIALFFLSQLVSAVFSMDPHVSWFGYYSRFNGGMWSVISYVVLYYAFVSNTHVFGETPEENSTQKSISKNAKTPAVSYEIQDSLYKLLRVSILTAFAIAIYGVLEHFGIDRHIWVQDVQNRVFSTLGQPNWLAAYLVALVPLTWYFALKSLGPKSQLTGEQIAPRGLARIDFGFDLTLGFWMWSLLSSLFFLVLLYTRSRSGLLGFAVADVVFWGFIIYYGVLKKSKKDRSQKFAFTPIIAIHALFALIVFFNGSYIPAVDKYVSLQGIKTLTTIPTSKQTATPSASAYTAPALEAGGTESGTIRKYVWTGAINAWKSSPKSMLIGTGTETFAFAFYQYRPIEHNRTSEWDFLYNKAHNEYLNYLATTGIFGLASYLLFICGFIWWFIKTHNSKTDTSTTINYALFAGWVSVLATNFFGFSVVVSQLVLFLFPAVIIALWNTQSSPTPSEKHVFPLDPPKWSRWLVLVLGVYMLIVVASFWYADKRFAKGYQLDRSGLYNQATPHLIAAATLNKREPLYKDELATNYSALAVASFTANDATSAASFAKRAVEESNAAIRISPKNVNFLKSRTKVYYALSNLDPSLNATAITTLENALELSPNDPKIYYNLAILAGRESQNGIAISHLLEAKRLKADYRDAYNALNIFYTEEGKKEEARKILEEYLNHINPEDQTFKERVGR